MQWKVYLTFVPTNTMKQSWNDGTHSRKIASTQTYVYGVFLLDPGATTASRNWILPCRELDGTWESLFFGDNTKQRLLRYAMTSLQLGEKGVDPNIVLCNRLILLHGPPGTGKTTICKAVAQKLSIRLSVYSHTQLVEVNCHSLFSKWFSESGKLVSKMFTTIRQYALDPEVGLLWIFFL